MGTCVRFCVKVQPMWYISVDNPGLLCLASALPIGDWQFWVVSAALLAAAGYLLRPAIRKLRGKRGTSIKATLTVGGKAMDGGRVPPKNG